MEKQDILVVATAIAAFAILVLLVRPILPGQPASLPMGGAVPEGGSGPLVTQPVSTSPGPLATVPPVKTSSPTPSPPSTPAWNGSIQNVGLIEQPGVTLPPSPTIPQPAVQNQTLVTYAVISGSLKGTTETLYIPSSWWVLEYTAVPWALPPDAFPKLDITVIDALNPNRVVIAPIDQDIYETPSDTPWTQTVYEGKRNYYFMIDTKFIKSYTITVMVPAEYS